MNYPPTKRLRGPDRGAPKLDPFDDSFGDDGDFTQDDLDEIDIMASQAFPTSSVAGITSKPETNGGSHYSGFVQPGGPSKSVFTGKRGNTDFTGKESLVTRQNHGGSGRDESVSLLEAQHADLKRKLKEVEDEIMLKSGEIRVLRDSLKAAQLEKETQRQNNEVLQIQRQKVQEDKEKELNRKVQSLKSELQFKEAEIIEMKTKLLSSDKTKTTSPRPRNSPKVVHHGSGSSSSSPSSHGFITKEMFGAEVASRMTPGKSKGKRQRDDTAVSGGRSSERQEVTRPDPFLSVRPANQQSRGSVLLGLMLQHPLVPSSLCLSHLLSNNTSDVSSALRGRSLGPSLHRVAASPGAAAAPLSPVQSLAVTGLIMLSHSRVHTGASSRNQRLCPGAVHFLPLLDFHLTRLCQTMDSLESIGVGARSTSSRNGSGSGLEDAGSTCLNVEEAGLAALRLLYLLLAHSDEVVECVLMKQNSVPDKQKARHGSGELNPNSQNALLPSVLRLCDVSGGGSKRDELVFSALRILVVLLERTPPRHSDRLQRVFAAVCACVSADATTHTVSECVSVLMVMSNNPSLAQQLGSHHDPCVLLKLFQFIRKRRADQNQPAELVQLDLQVVRLLISLTQTSVNWTKDHGCQCQSELVQTVVIIFHRQWLDLRGPAESPEDPSGPVWWKSPAASLLRECLQLLHWLLLHHSSFSESCRSLLHMYDQVVPAVKDTLRKIPDLSESEELALEEICRSEGDDADEDMDTGS